MGCKQALQDIAGGEEGIDHRIVEGEFPLPDAVQQILENMRDFRQVGEAEGAGRALDRMGGAEYRVQLFGVRIGYVELEQQGFHARQVLRRLLEEHLVELAHVYGHDRTLANDFLHDLEQLLRVEWFHQPACGAGGLALRLHRVG